MIQIEQYFDNQQWQKFVSASQDEATPLLVVDLNRIKHKYAEMVELFPTTKIHYAMTVSYTHLTLPTSDLV